VHWGLREWIEHDVHVTAPTVRRRRGIVHHRSEDIERTVHRGIPVTTPRRTIWDIAATARYKLLRSVVNRALGLELVRLGELITYSGRGATKLRRVLATAAPTKSENENLVLHLIHEAGLPTPLVNPPLRGTRYIPDFLWPERKLILEADSRRFHHNIIARADDATRQLVLETMGLRVIRTTWREATTRPAVVQRRVAEALGAQVR
jgi:very-short-patch-repair endonuclease